MEGERGTLEPERANDRRTVTTIWSRVPSSRIHSLIVGPSVLFPFPSHPPPCRRSLRSLLHAFGCEMRVEWNGNRETDQTVTKGLSSSSKFSGSCVPTLQTLPWLVPVLVPFLSPRRAEPGPRGHEVNGGWGKVRWGEDERMTRVPRFSHHKSISLLVVSVLPWGVPGIGLHH